MFPEDVLYTDKVIEKLRPGLVARASVAFQLYSAQHLAYNDPSYPFEKHDQLSVTDAGAQSVEWTPYGIIIAVTAPAAALLEYGNRPGSVKGVGGSDEIEGSPLLKIKRRQGGGRLSFGAGGQAYLALPSVAAYDGRWSLHEAVYAAFGVAFTKPT